MDRREILHLTITAVMKSSAVTVVHEFKLVRND